LIGQGFNDREIAKTPNLIEIKVHDCISWMLQAFRLPDLRKSREQLLQGCPRCRRYLRRVAADRFIEIRLSPSHLQPRTPA
jgi:hypothetical protein